MKKIITLVAFLMVFGSVSLWGADVTSRIDLLKGEKWWGISLREEKRCRSKPLLNGLILIVDGRR